MLTALIATGILPVGGTVPAPSGLVAQLKSIWPAFAGVADATVQFWLDRALPLVSQLEDDADFGQMLLAAHNMTLANVPGIAVDAVSAIAAKGVTSFRSASFSADFDGTAAKRRAGTGYASTYYGSEYLLLLRRYNGGPRLVGCY